MKIFNFKRFVKSTCIGIMSLIISLSVNVSSYADIWPNLESELCMADAYLLKPGNKLAQDALNCTANDVEITQVVPVNAEEECTLGETFSFPANVTVRTNANERWDTTFYLPLTEQSPQVVHNPVGLDCSILLPIPADSGETADVQLDGDVCGDITKALGPDEYTLMNQMITMICLDEDQDNRADFTYCAAWDNIERDNCTLGDAYPGQIPNNKSKCNCDTFNIDVFITPDPPTPEKTLTTTNTHTEPGGAYTFTYSFTNPSSASSLFITSLTDYVDEGANNSYESSIDLWGATEAAGSSDGVYLTATNCADDIIGTDTFIEISPSATFSCQFTVHIVDADLPDDQSPELYNDVINVMLEDKNGMAVGDGSTCPASLSLSNGSVCSDIEQVQVTNLPPTITVEKSVNPDSLLETNTGTLVTYTVKITNTSPFDPVTITEIKDAISADGISYGSAVNLAGDGDCQLSTVLAKDAWCDFTYQASLTGDTGDMVYNKVNAKAVDNESDEASGMDIAIVNFTNSPGMILLSKTPNPTAVTESGANVVFTFHITNTSAVDDLTLTELDDDIFGIIFDDSEFRADTGLISCDFYGDVLAPGDTRSCTIVELLSGEPGSGNEHTNTGTVTANTGDTIICPADAGHPEPYDCLEEVMDSDPAVVSFINEPADATLAVNIAATLYVSISNGSSYESVNLTELKLLGNDIATASGLHFNLMNDGGTFDGTGYGTCGQPSAGTPIVIVASGSYSCAFTVELLSDDGSADNIFSILSGMTSTGLSIKVTDDDGGAASESSVNVTVQLIPNL